MNMLDDDKKRIGYSEGETVQGTNLQEDYVARFDKFVDKMYNINQEVYTGFGKKFKTNDRNKFVKSEVRQQAKIANQLGLSDYNEEFINNAIKQRGIQDKANKIVKEVRANKAEGGSIDDQMQMAIAMPTEPEMESDSKMEEDYLDYIISEALSADEENELMLKLEQDDELSILFDKVIDVAQEFAGSGPVEGPGSGVSDSIPARLSDGEFVFTAKAVEEIGEDTLMSMMKDAEDAADERQGLALGGATDKVDKPVGASILSQSGIQQESPVEDELAKRASSGDKTYIQ